MAERVDAMWKSQTTSHAAVLEENFLHLYDLLTNKTVFQLGDQTDARSYVALVLGGLLHDQRRRPRIMVSILQTLQHNPHLCHALPALELGDKPDKKGFELDGKEKGILDKFFVAMTALLRKEHAASSLVHPPQASDFKRPPRPPKVLRIDPKNMPWHRQVLKSPHDVVGHAPQVSDFMCSSRQLQPLSRADLQGICDAGLADKMALSEDELRALVMRPLAAVLPLDAIIVLVNDQADFGRPAVPSAMLFDVSTHADAQSTVAKEMQHRLRADAACFAETENAARRPKLRLLLEADCARLCASPGDGAHLQRVLEQLKALKGDLQRLRDSDAEYVTLATPLAEHVANHVDLPSAVNPADADDEVTVSKLLYYLRRYSEHETYLWAEHLIATLLSSQMGDDWRRLNPFVGAAHFAVGTRLVTAILLKTNRIGQTSRALALCTALIEWLQRLQERPGSQSAAGLLQEADALAQSLTVERHFVDPALSFDPRFLVFEFTWNIILRRARRAT